MRTLPQGAFGGAPYGATNLVRGVPKWTGGRMRTLPLGSSVELPMGPRTVRGVCQNWAVAPCGPSRWGLRWGSLCGNEPREGAPKRAWVTHAGGPTGTFGGAPYGATKRCTGCA